MTTTRMRAALAGSLSALLLLSLSACGEDTGADGADGAQRTRAVVGDTGTAAGSGTASDAGSAAGEEHRGRLTKADLVDVLTRAALEKGSVHLSLAMGSTLSMQGDVAYRGTTPRLRADVVMSGQKMAVRLVDGVGYVQVPGLTPDGTWMKVDPEAPGTGALMGELGDLSPRRVIDALGKAVSALDFLASEEVDGEELDRYRVTLDASAALEHLGALGRHAHSGEVPDQLTADLYVDDEDLPRRVDLHVAGKDVVLQLSDWGEQVEVPVPPAAQVMTMPPAARG